MEWDQKNSAHFGAAAHHNQQYASSTNKGVLSNKHNAKLYTILILDLTDTCYNPIPWWLAIVQAAGDPNLFIIYDYRGNHFFMVDPFPMCVCLYIKEYSLMEN